MEIYALILAGGKSNRYGDNKYLEKIGGKTFLEWLIEKAENFHLKPIIVYYYEQLLRYGSRNSIFVKNDYPEREQLESIRLGVKNMKDNSDGFLLFLADMPLIQNKTIELILKKAMENPKRIVVPVYNGKTGHPTFFPNTTYEKFFEPLRDGARTLVYDKNTIKVPVEDIFTVIGVNTREEFKRYINEYKRIYLQSQ